MWKLGFPLALIVLMAYGVYILPSTAAAQQIALGMTSMLTLIAYMLALGSGLPKISYLTRADTFFVGSAALVFMGLATAILALALERAERADLARRLIRAGRVIYPLGISVNIVAAFLW
ncbi:MAG: hypothetical protein IH628_07350 [Proteobacteria bacterium]|nr:hypothetical protein [Pseudomonadota bacterium]